MHIIVIPALRVGKNIMALIFKLRLISDDPVIESGLPAEICETCFANAAGSSRLKTPDQTTYFFRGRLKSADVPRCLRELGIGGRNCNAIVSKPDDGMKVIRHDAIRIKIDIGPYTCSFLPNVFCQVTYFRQMHLIIDDFTEVAYALASTDGNKVRTGSTIMKVWKPYSLESHKRKVGTPR